ncbi:signal peptidase I [Saccharibacillus sp. JS10]|uniref:signal peptidase I n=1 Tax=Saccharibacillus sp. JS10 TaxID=2950552 RepID=UPI00210C2D08|nr:signal peptidase I [Saccharibacillus sp. JS10]MCQ4088427.1 signal peptidase I [Saccharibacillus sp. JS10]
MQILFIILILFSGVGAELSPYAQYVAEGPSMEPTISPGDKLLVDKEYYKSNPFERGDIVVFFTPNEEQYFKRVIGLPGETVKIQNDKLYINNQIQDEPYIEDEIKNRHKYGDRYTLDFAEQKVPDHTIFVLGDNRKNSLDSRFFGTIKIEKVIGKVEDIKL